jgi:peptide/nickel transport system substrate-binding protein
MRRLVVLVIFVVSFGFFSSCDSSRKENQAPNEEPLDRTLRIGTTQQIQTAFPFSDYALSIFLKIANPTLMAMNRDGNLVGLAAETYEVSEDFKTWTFTIRDDLFWNDGKKFSSRDAAFSFAYTGKNDPNAGWIDNTLVRTETPDDTTLIMEFNRPYTNLNLEFTTYNILPRHIWETVEDPRSYGGKPSYTGFGPFVLESVDLDQGLVIFTRNQYWKGTSPFFEKIEIHLYKTMDVLAMALDRGEIDVFYNYAATYPYAYLEKLAENPQFAFEEKLNLGLIFLSFNLKSEPMSQGIFREAVSWGINYEEIARLDALGYGTAPRRGFIPESMGGFIETEKLQYDPARANALLDQAGLTERNQEGYRERDGRELRLTMVIRQDYVRVGELIRDYLKDLGIALELKVLDMVSWVNEKDAFRYDMTITRSTPWGMLMHAGFGTGYFDSRRTGQGVLHNLEDPRFLALCDSILSTVDEERISHLAGEVQQYYAGELPGIPLYWNTIVIPHHKNIGGFISNPLFGIYSIESLVNARRN